MLIKTSSFWGPGVFLALLLFQSDLTFGAPIEDAIKSLKGLSGKERLARMESEARKEGNVSPTSRIRC
jgi:hypothetical protein